MVLKNFENTSLLGTDVDDTLTTNSTAVYIERHYLPAFQSIGIHLAADEFREMVQPVWGQDEEDVINFVGGEIATEWDIELNPAALLSAAKTYREIMKSGVFVDEVVLIPRVIETLQRVRSRGVLIGPTTGMPSEIFEAVRKRHGIPEDLFVDVVCADKIRKPERRKPHHYSLKKIKRAAEAFKKLPILNSEIVYAGDSANDVRMALSPRMKGVEPVAVLTGNITKEQAIAMGVPELNILKNICYIEEVLERREIMH